MLPRRNVNKDFTISLPSPSVCELTNSLGKLKGRTPSSASNFDHFEFIDRTSALDRPEEHLRAPFKMGAYAKVKEKHQWREGRSSRNNVLKVARCSTRRTVHRR